tara:strand:+ start:203 stop:1399 length:1197 start_codon:yes stop_codon:yes gene_type:complete
MVKNWHTVRLSEISSDIGDGIHATPKYVGHSDIFFINGNNLENGTIIISKNTKAVSEQEYNKFKLELDKNTILISINGTIGNLAIYNNEKIVLGKSASYVKFKKNIDVKFLFHALQTFYVKNYFFEELTGTTINNLSLQSLRNTPIKLPIEKKEQHIISDNLFDIDELINSLESLIQKKKNIKQGAMQELLTGKKRLEGFSGDWEEYTLKDIVKIPVTDGPHETPLFLDDGVPFLSVNNIVNNKIAISNLRYISKKDHERFSKKCKPMKGDILLGKAASVGHVAIVDFYFDFNIWSPLALLRINDKNTTKFIYYYIQSQHIEKQINFFTNSSSQGNLGMGDIEKLIFLLPSKKEQLSITEILSDIDGEINELKKQLEKYTNLKQAMMQKLLTGEIRLV